MKQVWFITGSSRGFGRALVRAALEAGDLVAATARRQNGRTGGADVPLTSRSGQHCWHTFQQHGGAKALRNRTVLF